MPRKKISSLDRKKKGTLSLRQKAEGRFVALPPSFLCKAFISYDDINFMFKNTIILLLSVFLIGCGNLDVNIRTSHSSPEYFVAKYPSRPYDSPQGLTSLNFSGGWTAFTFKVNSKNINNKVDSIRVVGAKLVGEHIESGKEFDGSFIQRLDIYTVGSDELPDFLLASYDKYDSVYNDSSLTLNIHEDINLKEYLSQSGDIYVFIQGYHPGDSFKIYIEFEIEAIKIVDISI